MISAGSTTYTYDAVGRRVRKTVSGTSSDYLYDLAGRAINMVNGSSGAWVRGEIFAGSRHLATYANNTTYFAHSDWLGTERVHTNVSGGIAESFTSLPFGDALSSVGSVSPLHFTGDERDSESGLDHTWFRQYSSAQGRWLTPDPLGGYIGNPQSLNRYAYVMDTPTGSVDRLGLERTKLLAIPPLDWSCSLNGIATPCSVVGSVISAGAGVQCPYNICEGFTNDGRIVAYHAFASGGAGYYAFAGPGSLYFSLEAAGKAAALYYWKLSDSQQREYGGTIYLDANGIYSFGQPQIGPSCDVQSGGCGIFISLAVPSGTTLVGDYHTHPGFGQGASDFSNVDTENLIRNSLFGFLGTAPFGRVVMFDPNRYSAFMAGGNVPPVCVLQGPGFGVPPCH